MNKRLFLFFIIFVFGKINGEELISQGKVKLSYEDVDGFAYTMPALERAGYFMNIHRLDRTITNLLNGKHMARYALVNLKFNKDDLEKKAKKKHLISFNKYFLTNLI